MLKAKKDFILTKMLDDYMIIAVGESAEHFRNIIQTNETGAFLWSMLEKGTTVEDMASACLDHYEGLDETIAREDIAEFITNINAAIVEV